MAIGISINRLRRCPKRPRAITAWVLITGFLLQPILAYLVTPLIAHDAQGQQIVICTLKGQKILNVDIPQLAENEQTEHCAALKLYQVAGTTQVSQLPVVPVVSLYAVELLEQTAEHAHHSLHFSAYSTRAPPLV